MLFLLPNRIYLRKFVDRVLALLEVQVKFSPYNVYHFNFYLIGTKPRADDLDSVRKFDERMQVLGFKRSSSQPNTLGDGNCGPRALCDQLNLSTNDEDPDFGRDDHTFLRRSTVRFMKQQVALKNLDGNFLAPSPAEYLTEMASEGTYVDNMFLQSFSKMVEKDILIMPVHARTTCTGSLGYYQDFTWIKGIESILRMSIKPYMKKITSNMV